MSTLYLGTDQIALAERLAEDLDEESRAGDAFRPATIVVPNRYLAKWLRLWLARTRGIAINLQFAYLESALWELLREQDPRTHALPLELVDHDGYRLMVLSVLLDRERPPELGPLHNYVHGGGAANELARDAWRRAWQLADRLARLIRDYEYHRQDALIQKWLRHDLGYRNARDSRAQLELSQRAVFEAITRLPDGKRERFGRAANKIYKTLPQYAMEIMELQEGEAASKSGLRPIHLFGTMQVSALHWRTLRWLGSRYDLRLYHLNPLVAQLPDVVTAPSLQKAITDLGEAVYGSHAGELPHLWSGAGMESLALLSELAGAGFLVEKLADKTSKGAQAAKAPSVLSRLQDCLLNRVQNQPVRLPQDKSLQIVGCPGPYREVETAYHSIVHNLQATPDLKQTDIAILVADMGRYRPVLQAVFEREPRRLRYNMADYSAAGMSAFGEAFLALFDLALDGFTRSRVFNLLLNPCFLARLRTDRAEAATWLTWAEKLGVYHSWDANDKAERGYGSSSLFGWQLAMRRLRLGQIMDAPGPRAEGGAPRFRDVVPYADLASGDKERLDVFCRAVEGLLPVLARLRTRQLSGGQWATLLQQLGQRFLAVPPDRPEEGQVCDQLARALDKLRALDQLSDEAPVVPLPLIREVVASSLEGIEGAKGEFLTGGVTISALQPLRPVPFRIIYVLGLGEELFPGSNRLPSDDLRALHRCTGDILPAEQNRYLFLETLLAARDKLYLLYTNRDLQRDQEFQPCVPLVQLRQFLDNRVVENKFAEMKVPLSACDPRYLMEATTVSDVVVNYDDDERLLAIAHGQETGDIVLGPKVEAEIARRSQRARRDFSIAPAVAAAPARPRTPTVAFAELRRFLRCPAAAALRRHLRLGDDDDMEVEDDEPFTTDALTRSRLTQEALQGFVARALRQGVDEALSGWPSALADLFEDWRLRCRLPEGVFGELDQAALAEDLNRRLTAPAGLAGYLQARSGAELVGPVLVGESLTPVHARHRFPALHLKFADSEPFLFSPGEALLSGSIPLVWRSESALDILVVSAASEEVKEHQLCKAMLEPVIGYLALKAGIAPGPEGLSSREWVGARDLRLAVAHASGITTYTYRAAAISEREAYDYLRALAADFLDPTSFDLLPFELIITNSLRTAYQGPGDEARALASRYKERLEDLIERDKNALVPAFRWSDVLTLADPQVPGDAITKVRQRFALLARGLVKIPQTGDKKRANKPRRG